MRRRNEITDRQRKTTLTERPAKRLTADEALLWDIVAAFTRYHTDIAIETDETADANAMIQFTVHRDDHPRVIGSMGKHIQALRTIFQFIGAREERKIRLILLEPTVGQKQPEQIYKTNMAWQAEVTKGLLQRLLARILAKPFEIEILSIGEITNVEIHVHEKDREIIDALKPSLHAIFHAIGKNDGRRLYVETPAPIPAMR